MDGIHADQFRDAGVFDERLVEETVERHVIENLHAQDLGLPFGAQTIGAFAQKNNGKIILTEAVISEDGKQSVRVSGAGEELHELGERLAQLVLERGAGDLLAERAAQWET